MKIELRIGIHISRNRHEREVVEEKFEHRDTDSVVETAPTGHVGFEIPEADDRDAHS